MVNISDRWNRSKTDDLQFAFFNGEGWESWENIWGIWNGITPRDGEATRRVASIERGMARFFVSARIGSRSTRCTRYGVFASRWPLGNQTVWTIVNRNEYDVARPRRCQSRIRRECATSTSITGPNSSPSGTARTRCCPSRSKRMGSAPSWPRSASQTPPQCRTARDHEGDDRGAAFQLFERMEGAAADSSLKSTHTMPCAAAPEGMVKIPGGDYVFKVEGIEIEGFNDIGVDVQYPWEDIAAALSRAPDADQAVLSSTNTRSPMRSSRNFSTRRDTIRATI